MNIPSNPTAGRGTPVYVMHLNGPALTATKAHRPAWLVSVNDNTKRAMVWLDAKLVSVPVGNLSERAFSS